MTSEPQPPVVSAPRRSWRRWLFLSVVVLSFIQPLAQLLSRFDWRADLLSHFPELALGVTLVALVLSLRRDRGLAVALAVLALWQTVPLVRYSGANPVAADPRSPARLRILLANVFIENERYEDLARLIARERPDIVGLVEYTPAWQAGLEEISKEFPSRTDFAAGPDGLALWFREPPREVDPVSRLRSPDRPFLHATFDFGGRTRHLWLLHPHQPLNPAARHAGNPELAALGERIGATEGSKIVIGDLNTSDGSRNFAAFLRRIGLRDSRYGFGRQGSFPADSRYRIPIDHAFVAPDLAVVVRRLGPSTGSDHFPLIVELAPAIGFNEATTSSTKAAQSSP